jgi:hypothetical protein
VTGELEREVKSFLAILAAGGQELGTLKASVDTIAKQLGRGSTLLQSRFTKLDHILEEGSGALDSSLGGVATRLDNVRIPPDMVVSRFDATWAQVEPSVLGAAGTLDGMSRSASEVQKQNVAVASTLQTVRSQFDGVQAATGELLRLLEVLRKQNIGLEAQGASESAKHLATVERSIAEVRALGDQLQGVVAEVLAFVREHLTEAVR